MIRLFPIFLLLCVVETLIRNFRLNLEFLEFIANGPERSLLIDFVNSRFVDKLHLSISCIIPYGYFLKVYVIQKKFSYINLGGQEKMQRKCELASCVSNQFNGMLTVRALNQDQRRKNYLPVYIFIDCATSLRYYNSFSKNPKSAFVAHYEEEKKIPNEKKCTSVTTVTRFLGTSINIRST